VSSHRLGFAVKVLGEGGLPSHDARRWQSRPHLSVSLERLRDILDYLDRHELPMYRMVTALAPYASHPDLPRFHGQVEECAEALAKVGALARERDIRLSTHPGQYTVLNSEDERVRRSAAAELEVQAALLDGMGLPPEAVSVIHVGGRAGGPEAAADRFLRGWELLSEPARRRVVIENDDRSFGVTEAVAISARCGAPVVWDILHHRCHDPDRIPDREALAMALATWPQGVVPKIHYSSPRLDVGERRRKVGRRIERTPELPQLRAHADLVEPIGFEYALRELGGGADFDVMIEAKAKDLAVLRLREQLAARGMRIEAGRLKLPHRDGRATRHGTGAGDRDEAA
jgi:UV DNA damage endonuclease